MAGDKAVSTASKPMMRGLLNASIKRNLIVSLVMAGISGIAFKELVGTARKKRYAEFYRLDFYILFSLILQYFVLLNRKHDNTIS
jgi:hypothetical protein